MDQISMFEKEKFRIQHKIKLIELFAGYGSQALALKYLGVPFEHHKICEWAIKSIQAYKDIHFSEQHIDVQMDKAEMVDYLLEKGVSADYNNPMTRSQLARLPEQKLRTIVENILVTNNLVNIQNISGKDLEIVDTDKWTYILCYSFPCQDLSLAGRLSGMSDATTRSGLLWEVGRILQECKELGALPAVLIMENVIQVHNKRNKQSFDCWKRTLEQLGYSNYWQDMIACDYGIPQTRNRTFMVSILGNASYRFPDPVPLKLKLKDLLEDSVDEMYYIKDETKMVYDAKDQMETQETIKIKNATKLGYLEAQEGDGIDITGRKNHRGTVQKDKAQTIKTSGGEEVGVVVRK